MSKLALDFVYVLYLDVSRIVVVFVYFSIKCLGIVFMMYGKRRKKLVSL